MRFTKQLTACLATIGTVFFASAALSACDPDPRAAADAKKNRDFWDGLNGSNSEGVLLRDMFGGLKQINGESCADAAINTEEFPFPSYTNFLPDGWVAVYRGASLGESILGKFILGETQDGKTMKIYCNPGNCTVGSLNRFSVLTGAPMMVPAVLLAQARGDIERDALDDSGVWKTVASVIWSDPKRLTKITETYDDALKPVVEVTYKLEPDVNAIRARKIYEKSPEAYKSKQEAFKKSLNTGDKLILRIKGVVSTVFSADVETVVSDDDVVVVTEKVKTKTCSWDYDALGYLQLSCE